MLGFTETGQVGVEGGHDRTFVTEINLNLGQVLALFEQVGRVAMAQTVHVQSFLEAAFFESQAKGARKPRAGHRLGGGRGVLAAMAFGREKQRGMFMSFPLLTQELQSALGQGDVTIRIAFALADVQEHAPRIDIRDAKAQAFAQAQTARIDGGQTNPMIQRPNRAKDQAHFLGRGNDRQFKLGIGARQFQFVGPGTVESFFPEKLDGAEGLSAGLAGDLLGGFEMNEVLAELFGGDQFWRAVVELGELAHTDTSKPAGCAEGWARVGDHRRRFLEWREGMFFICIALFVRS